MDDIHDVLGVIFFQKLEDLKLYSGLIVVLFLVFDDFDGHINSIFVIEAFESRAKRSLAEEWLDLKAIPNMVIVDYFVVAFVVIIAIIVL